MSVFYSFLSSINLSWEHMYKYEIKTYFLLMPKNRWRGLINTTACSPGAFIRQYYERSQKRDPINKDTYSKKVNKTFFANHLPGAAINCVRHKFRIDTFFLLCHASCQKIVSSCSTNRKPAWSKSKRDKVIWPKPDDQINKNLRTIWSKIENSRWPYNYLPSISLIN